MRVVGYARTSDYVFGAVAAACGPGLMFAMEKLQSSRVGRGGLARAMRLAGFIGLCGGFLAFYNRSCSTFPGTGLCPPGISKYTEGKAPRGRDTRLEDEIQEGTDGITDNMVVFLQCDSTATQKTPAR